MKTSKLFLIFFTALLLLPIVSADTEQDQLSNIIRQVKDRILGVQMPTKPCLFPVLSMLNTRMDEMIGAQAFLANIADPVTWARQLLLSFGADLAISEIQALRQKIIDYATKGRRIIWTEYEPGWGRWAFGDECKNFKLQFIWFKDENLVKILSSGNCGCKYDLEDFFIQFDVRVRARENVNSNAAHKYEVVGFSNPAQEQHRFYFDDPDEESNAIIKVNCCKKCPVRINWEEETESEESGGEVGFKTAKKDLLFDPDNFLAILKGGSIALGTLALIPEPQENLLKKTLCSKIDTVPKPTPTPDVIRTPKPTKTPDTSRTPIPTPTRDLTHTPTPTLPPIIPTRTPTPVPTLPPVISTKTPTPTLTPTSTPVPTPIDCNQVCASEGWSTQKKDWSNYIFNEVNKYTCVSGAKINQPGSYKMGPCTCYDLNEKPKIEIDTRIPFCKNTFCGDVPCGETKTCQEPGAAYSAYCEWKGWRMGSSGLPSPVFEVG